MSRFSRRLQTGSRAATSPPPYAVPLGGPAGIAWGAPVFEDNFDGSSLDTNKWAPSWFNGSTMNEVSTSPANVAVTGGNLVKSYVTHDGEAPQYLIFNVGTKASRTQVFGAASRVFVDYVRVWA